MRGSVIMARASATRWRWPPDRLRRLAVGEGARSRTAASTSATRCGDLGLRLLQHLEAEADLLGHRHVRETARSPGTSWRCRAARADRRVTSPPPIRMSPSSGSSSPAMQRSVVVLPQPEGPSRQTNCPLPTSQRHAVDGDEVAIALADAAQLQVELRPCRHRRRATRASKVRPPGRNWPGCASAAGCAARTVRRRSRSRRRSA